MPAHKASPVQLSDEYERQLNDLVRAHSTPQRLAERARIVFLAAAGLGIDETAQPLGDLAQDRRSLAAPVAGCGTIRRRGGASERCAPLRCAGGVHARGDLPDYGAGL